MLTIAFLLATAVQDDAAAKAALDTFKASYGKSKDAKVRVECVAELAKTLHESVAAKLGSLLSTDEKEVRIAAATGLGGFNKPAELKVSAAKHLGQGLTAGPNAREVDVRVAIFAALGTLQEESSVNTVKAHFDDKDAKIACAAVAAAGAIRSKTLIDPLIQVLRENERAAKAPPPSGPTPGTGTGSPLGPVPPPGKGKPASPPPPKPPTTPPQQRELDKETKDRANAVIGSAESALVSITRQDGLKTGDEWEKWWIKNRTTFTVPK